MSGIAVYIADGYLSRLARDIERAITQPHVVTNTGSVSSGTLTTASFPFPTQGYYHPYGYIGAPRSTHRYISRHLPYERLPFKGTDFAPPPEPSYFALRAQPPQLLRDHRLSWARALPRRWCARPAFHYRPARRRSH